MDFTYVTYHAITPMFQYFHDILGNYGWAILAVTILIKVGLYPLTKKQTESMKSMQVLQPKIKGLQERFNQQKERYKDKPEKLKELQADFQKDMMEFYQQNKVNPLGGCFPMLIQLPILIALFWAFNGSPFKPVSVSAPIEIIEESKLLNESRSGASKSQIYISEDGKRGRFVLTPGNVKVSVGKTVEYNVAKLEGNAEDLKKVVEWKVLDSPLYSAGYKNKKDISDVVKIEKRPDGTVAITPKKPGKVYVHGVFPASHADEPFFFISGLGKTGLIDKETSKFNFDVFVLVMLFAFTIWLSGKITAASAPPPADEKQAEMQKMMQKMMPPMIGVMMLFFPVPAGVLLYFVVSGLIQALQTWMVMKPSVAKAKNDEPEILLDQKPKKKEKVKVKN